MEPGGPNIPALSIADIINKCFHLREQVDLRMTEDLDQGQIQSQLESYPRLDVDHFLKRYDISRVSQKSIKYLDLEHQHIFERKIPLLIF